LTYQPNIAIFARMKRAIIVGASSGIGREVSKILLADGWRIGVAARREDKLQELKSINKDMVEVERIDVTADDAPQRLLTLIENLGGIELFFYASGVGKQNYELDASTEADTVNVNAKGFTLMVDTAFNYMAKGSGGHIAVISSIAGTKGLGAAPSYSATKAYQNMYIEALEQLANMRRLNITFTDIRPGFVDTPLLAGGHYPMLLNKTKVAHSIIKAIYSRHHVVTIDWRYRTLVFFWRMIPRWLWRQLNISTRS